MILPRTRNRILVAEAGGRVVGWIHVAESLTLESGPSAEIAGLVVEERERSAGVGARLLAEAETWAAAAGFARMRVRSNVKRNRARRFYEREGFVVTKQQRNFEKALTRPGS